MKSGLQVGTSGELHWIVDPSMTISLGGLPQATVFSTPNMIMLMERAAREALRPFLEASEESVGTEVLIEHVGAASLGSSVRGVAHVTSIEDRKITFDVKAYTGDREIGRGRHRRAVIQLSRFIENLAKLGASPSNAKHQLHVNSSNPLKGPSHPLVSDKTELPMKEWNQLKTLDVSVQDKIATVKLNRPKSLNAVNLQMTSELEMLVAWLADHPELVRVVILTGAGENFCAGDDVKEVEQLSLDEARVLSLRQGAMYLRFEQLPQPIIAAVNGVAFGAGCVAAYSCDFRVASHNSQFGMPEIKLGWPPGYGLSQLTALVGKARALEMCLLGQPISAKVAGEWGLVHEVVASAQLMKRCREIAEQLMQLPSEALRQTKRLLHADEGSLPKVTYLADTDAYIRCLELPDAREGIRAFIEKRSPKFSGR